MSIVIKNNTKPAANQQKRKAKAKKAVRNGNRSKRSRVARRSPTAINPAIYHQLCSITDPFCAAAKGARWPDSNASPTIAVTLQGIVPLITDTNGNAAVSFGPNPITGYQTFTVNNTSGNLTAADNGSYNGYDQFPGVSEYRLVSGGVQIFSTASLQTSSGMLRAIEVPSVESQIFEDLNAYSYDYTRSHDKPVREFGSLFQYLRPGSTESRNFEQFVPSTSTQDWTTALLTVTGGQPETTVALVYYVFHYEYKFGKASVFNKMAARPPGENTVLTQLSNYVSKEAGGIIEGYQKQVEEKIKDTATTYLKQTIKAGTMALPGILQTPANMLVDQLIH
nr:hypothetical protein [Tolivirales sp.]